MFIDSAFVASYQDTWNSNHALKHPRRYGSHLLPGLVTFPEIKSVSTIILMVVLEHRQLISFEKELSIVKVEVSGFDGVSKMGMKSYSRRYGQFSHKLSIKLSTDWTQLEVIDLINDGTGLGFGIIGGRSTGVVVKTILPGGIADLDGHLHSGDHILQIGEVNVRGMGSEQVALVLRQSGSHVRLVVARSVMEPPQYQLPHAPVIPTHQLEDHMEHFNAVMAMEAGEHEQHLHNLHLHNIHLQQQIQLQQQQQIQQQQQTMLGSVQVHPQPTELIQDLSDVDVFEVDLLKDSNGLGITIAGYVGGDNTPDEISGIFVKSITEGSAAALDGRVHVNDQIIEVDGNSLQGFSNHQAVEVLRNTSQLVRLKLVRFRHGPKYDKLQEYLAQANQLVAPPIQAKGTPAVSNPTYDLDSKQVELEDIQIITEDYTSNHGINAQTEQALKNLSSLDVRCRRLSSDAPFDRLARLSGCRLLRGVCAKPHELHSLFIAGLH
ncbi:hypothetical protein RRG08_053970 [Elysia crispata]|uniref:PDZ domain-containing protein n=1 Tax=Elysia crispata TaxID=231223 RepID=A0AAE0ZEE4_9GAST|nr:hypothetical protein RRG08_053970 [Elysia crispata]